MHCSESKSCVSAAGFSYMHLSLPELSFLLVSFDGRTDLALTDSAVAGRVAILPRKAGLDFGGPLKYAVGSRPYGLAVGRLTGDNRLDVATANYTGTTSVLQGN